MAKRWRITRCAAQIYGPLSCRGSGSLQWTISSMRMMWRII